MKSDPDDLRDEEVDPVLERLVATLPAERAFAGDDGIVARSAAAAIARRAARTSRSKSDEPSTAPPRRAWSWIALAAASAVLVGVAVTTLVGQSTPPAPAAPQAERVDRPPTATSPVHAPAPEAPSKDDEIPALDVSALPTVAAPKAAAAPAPPSTARESAPAHPRTAAEMFANANDARRRRESSASDLYRELQSTYPSSPEAILSYVTLGRLELDHGRASYALAQFDRYVATNTAELREDALGGRANALESLGRTAEELRAWETLLSEYPRTLLAAHAKERITTLR
jgi:TolA-binding protein